MDDLEDLARRQARPQNGVDPTRSRPPPWFVGSGRGLMMAVLSIVALLILVRGLSTIWMVEAAWDWWRHRPAALPPGAPLVARAPPRIDAALPATTLPHGATPARGKVTEWISADDYPPEAIRRNQQGRTGLRWTIGVDGRVSKCGVTRSSGSAWLDAAGCRALIQRGRYEPARDADGRAIPSTASRTIVWRLPDA